MTKLKKYVYIVMNILCLVIITLTVSSLLSDLITNLLFDSSSVEESYTYSSSSSSGGSSSSSSSDSSTNTQTLTSFSDEDIADMFTDRDLDYDYDESTATSISLDDETITISEEGVYILSGSISDGQVIVEASDSAKIQLVLDGVTINSSSSAAIYVILADKVFITLADNSDNTLSTSGEYVDTDDEGVDAVVYSKSDITFNGTGTLTINATYGHGIEAKDDIAFTSGTYIITSKNHGINANDSIRIVNADFTIDSGKDGMQCENSDDTSKGYIYIASGTFTINSVADCMDASSCLQIDGGEFDLTGGNGYEGVLNSITVGEGSSGSVMATDTLEYSMKCIKAGTIIFNDGIFNLSAYEDTIHSNGDLTMNGGEFYIVTGDDAIHADYDLTINDAIIEIEYGYEGIEGDNITINGGTISVIVLDDGINAGSSSGTLTITGGDIYVACQGDGFDSNGDFEMTGGNVVLDVSAIYTAGDSEIDVTGSVSYTGGSIVDENGDEVSTSGSSSSSSSRSFSVPSRR